MRKPKSLTNRKEKNNHQNKQNLKIPTTIEATHNKTRRKLESGELTRNITRYIAFQVWMEA